MHLPSNAHVRFVRRIGGMDRYGNPIWEIIYHMLPVFMDRSTGFVRVGDGDSKQIDATMRIYSEYQIQAGDELEMDTPRDEKYTVFAQSEDYDANGVLHMLIFQLVKVVQQA